MRRTQRFFFHFEREWDKKHDLHAKAGVLGRAAYAAKYVIFAFYNMHVEMILQTV
jgi:hypothetical protein